MRMTCRQLLKTHANDLQNKTIKLIVGLVLKKIIEVFI